MKSVSLKNKLVCVSLSASHTLTHSPRWAHAPQYTASLTSFWHTFLKYRLIGSWVKETGDCELGEAFKVTDYRCRISICESHSHKTKTSARLLVFPCFFGNIPRRITTKETVTPSPIRGKSIEFDCNGCSEDVVSQRRAEH